MTTQSLADVIIAKHKTHLIFDFDATLFLMHIPWNEWGEDIRDELLALDVELWEHHQFKGGSGFQNKMVGKYGKRGLDLMLRHSSLFEMQHKEKFARNEQLLQEIEEFKDTYHMFIWSSNSRQLVDSVLQQNGMGDWFEKIVSRNEVQFLKPSGEGFAYIHDPQVPKSRYLLIGDSSHDREAALDAGIDFYHTDFFNQGR